MNFLQVCVLGAASLLLLGCGGGGGGGGTSERQQTPVAGNLVILSQANALRLGSNAYSMLDLVVELADPGTTQRPWYLRYEPESYPESSPGQEECSSGSMDVQEETVSTDSRNIILALNACVIDEVTFTGSITYAVKDGEFPGTWSQQVTISNLQVEDGTERLDVAGKLGYSNTNGTRYDGDLRATSSVQKRTLSLSNLRMDATSSSWEMSATFTDSVEGTVDLVLDNNTIMLMKGANGSLMTIAPILSNMPSLSGDIQHFVLGLENFALYPFPLKAKLTPGTFVEWPYLTNAVPSVAATEVPEITRLENLDLTFSEFFEDESDFLSFSIAASVSDPGCRFSSLQSDFDKMTFVFPCQGDHAVTVTASDGVHAVNREIQVSVTPRAAEFSPLDDQQLVAGEMLSLPVHVANEKEDGPFEFSLTARPHGLSISSSGVISGEPIPLLKEGDTTFNVGIQAEHVKQSSTNFRLDYSGVAEEKSLVPAQTRNRCFAAWVNITAYDHPVRVCSTQHSSFIEGFVGGALVTEYAVPAPPASGVLMFALWGDVNADGQEDWLLGYDRKLVAIDLKTKQVVREIALPAGLLQTELVKPLVSGGKLSHSSFLLHHYVQKKLFLVDLVAGNYKELVLPSTPILFGNVTGDSAPDIVFENGRISDLQGVLQLQIEPVSGYETFRLHDLDGDGIAEFVRLKTDLHGNVDSTGIRVARIGHLDSFAAAALPSPEPGEAAWYSKVSFVDLDGDGSEELLARRLLQNVVHVYEYSSATFDLRRSVELPAEYSGATLAVFQRLTGDDAFVRPASAELSAYVYNYGASKFVQVEDERPEFKVEGSSKLFEESDGNYALFLAQDAVVQRVVLGQTGLIQSVQSYQHGMEVDARSIIRADADQDGIDEYVFVTVQSGSGSQYRLVNAESGYVYDSVTVSGALHTPLLAGDLDGNNVLDFFGARGTGSICLGLYRTGKATPDQTLYCDTQLHEYKLQDLDGDGKPELIDLRESAAGFEIRLYRYSAGSMKLIMEHQQSDKDAGYNTAVGVQDVDGDGRREIIVSFGILSGQRMYVFSESGMLNALYSALPFSFPDIHVSKASVSLIGVSTGGASANRTMLYEISPVNGAVIWHSRNYSGGLSVNGLHVLGPDLYGAPKLMITDDGILRL